MDEDGNGITACGAPLHSAALKSFTATPSKRSFKYKMRPACVTCGTDVQVQVNIKRDLSTVLSAVTSATRATFMEELRLYNAQKAASQSASKA